MLISCGEIPDSHIGSLDHGLPVEKSGSQFLLGILQDKSGSWFLL